MYCICSSLDKCCSGEAVFNFGGILPAIFESELEAGEAK